VGSYPPTTKEGKREDRITVKQGGTPGGKGRNSGSSEERGTRRCTRKENRVLREGSYFSGGNESYPWVHCAGGKSHNYEEGKKTFAGSIAKMAQGVQPFILKEEKKD